jgi:hypothetical protein
MTREEKLRRLEEIKSMPAGKKKDLAIKDLRKHLYLKLESFDPVQYQIPTDDRTSIETSMVQEGINSTPGALALGTAMAPLGVPGMVAGSIVGGMASSQALSPITSRYVNRDTVEGFKEGGVDGFHDALNGRVFNPETGQMEVPPNRISRGWGKAESISKPVKKGTPINATQAMLEAGIK